MMILDGFDEDELVGLEGGGSLGHRFGAFANYQFLRGFGGCCIVRCFQLRSALARVH